MHERITKTYEEIQIKYQKLKPGEYCSRGETALNPYQGDGWVGNSAAQPGLLTLEQKQW